jgi:hypothetical protein
LDIDRRTDCKRCFGLLRKVGGEERDQLVVDLISAYVSGGGGSKNIGKAFADGQEGEGEGEGGGAEVNNELGAVGLEICTPDQTSVVVVAAAAPASSKSCRILTPASEAAFSSAAGWVSENQAGALMTAPWTFLPRKSSADWMRDLMKMDVTSETLRMRSAGIGSERGVGACEAAGVFS